MPERPTRRELRFGSLEDAVREAEGLHRSGYRRVGNWDLSQTCGHLADWLTFPVEGFPPAPLPVRALLFVMRNTVGPRLVRKSLETGKVPGGAPTIPATVPAPGGDEAEAVARLRRAVGRFLSHEGPYLPSPLAGPLDRDESTRLQALHCAHHLGHLLPAAEG